MRLLAERFDRATGRCLAALPTGWSVRPVHVTRDAPPALEDIARPPAHRPDLPGVIAAIQGTAVLDEADAVPTPIRRPRFVDLDPTAGLPPTLARLDRLIRAILTDPLVHDPKEFTGVAAQAARRQQPAAHARLIAEAFDRLRPWLDGAFGRMLGEAESIERGVSWTVAWPPHGADRTLFQGMTDLYWRRPTRRLERCRPRHRRVSRWARAPPPLARLVRRTFARVRPDPARLAPPPGSGRRAPRGGEVRACSDRGGRVACD